MNQPLVNKRLRLVAVQLYLILGFAPVHSFGQSKDQPSTGQVNQTSDQPIVICNLGLPMTFVRVQVMDRQGWYVFNLSHDDFIIYEDGKPQLIQIFTREVIDPQSPWIGYTIGYYQPDSTRDGRRRRVHVKIRDGRVRGLKAHCQPDFYTLDPEEPQGPSQQVGLGQIRTKVSGRFIRP